MVIMSISAYENMIGQLELKQKLIEAEMQLAAGAEPIAHDEVFRRLREKYGQKS